MCLTPITLRVCCTNHHLGYKQYRTYTVPCGKCLECVEQYTSDWKVRLTDEFNCWPHAFFGTFTYDDAHTTRVAIGQDIPDLDFLRRRLNELPVKERSRYRNWMNSDYDYLFADKFDYLHTTVPIVNKYEIQCFLKRLRETYFLEHHKRLNVKYFITAEYGPNTLRPHYHMVFFTDINSFVFKSLVHKCYDLGNIHDFHELSVSFASKSGKVQDVSAAMAYVAKYCCKPAQFENPYVVCGVIPKPFRLISKGIGKRQRDRLRTFIEPLDCPKLFRGNRKLGNCYGYNPEYLEWILHQFTIINKQGYKIRTPRYYKAAMYPQVTVTEKFTAFDKNSNSYVQKSRKTQRKDCFHSLSIALDSYVQDKYIRLCQDKFRALKAQFPTASDSDLWCKLLVQDQQDLAARASQAAKRISAYFEKNSLNYSY